MAQIEFKGVDPQNYKIKNGDYILVQNESTGAKIWCIYSEYLPAVIDLSTGRSIAQLASKNIFLKVPTNGYCIINVIFSENAHITIT